MFVFFHLSMFLSWTPIHHNIIYWYFLRKSDPIIGGCLVQRIWNLNKFYRKCCFEQTCSQIAQLAVGGHTITGPQISELCFILPAVGRDTENWRDCVLSADAWCAVSLCAQYNYQVGTYNPRQRQEFMRYLRLRFT